ncbi:MAG: hypothetical protein U0X91_29640 [Spirosomataceae bacterium]
MEATGHYYTVYYISLAVGFPNNEAQKIAFYTQMADQVHELDATDQEKAQAVKLLPSAATGAALGGIIVAYMISIGAAPETGGASLLALPVLAERLHRIVEGIKIGAVAGIKIQEIIDAETRTANDWRLTIEYGLHALTGKNAEAERKITTNLLKSTSGDQPVRFGFLIHRLGDTYAHTMPNSKYLHKSSESMANLMERGHLWEGTHSDHGWERQNIFFSYIDNLYEVLNERAAKSIVGRTNTLPLNEIKRFYNEVFTIARNVDENMAREIGFFERIVIYEGIKPTTGIVEKYMRIEKTVQKIIIGHIKNEVKKKFKVIMDSYRPENEELMTLDMFLKQNPKIKNKAGKNITAEDIRNIVRTIAQNVTPNE